MSLALRTQVVSQASQHFRSSEKQAICEGCFFRQSVCSVISLSLWRGIGHSIGQLNTQISTLRPLSKYRLFNVLPLRIAVCLLLGEEKEKAVYVNMHFPFSVYPPSFFLTPPTHPHPSLSLHHILPFATATTPSLPLSPHPYLSMS